MKIYVHINFYVHFIMQFLNNKINFVITYRKECHVVKTNYPCLQKFANMNILFRKIFKIYDTGNV